MGVKIVMAVCMLPLLPMLYGAAWFTGKEKLGIQYGVVLWPEAEDSPQVQMIRKNERKELKRCMLFGLLLFGLTLLPNHESLLITGQVAWMFFIIIWLFVPYVRAHGKLLDLKREYLASLSKEEQEQTGNQILVDVTAAAVEKPGLFQKSLWAGCFFALTPALAEVFLQYLYPDPEKPELWICELTFLSIGAAALLFPLWLHFQTKQKVRVFTCDSQINLQIARIRQYHWSRFGAAMVWGTGLFNWGMLLCFHIPPRWFVWAVSIISLLYGGFSLGISFYCWYLVEKNSRKYLNQKAVLREDDDEHWIWGMFYYNKNDSRVMVENRAGIGSTCNMAKPGIKYGMIIVLIALFLGMFGVCGWSILEEFTPVSLIYEEDVLIANHWKETYRIEKQDIEQIELLEEEPEIRRVSGTSMETVEKGDFYSSLYEQNLYVCLNPQEPPFLLIETKDEEWYLLGSGKEGETREIYRRLQFGAFLSREK